jgi:hypothetical protein
VVGSWPEPFAQASAEGERQPVRVECLAGGSACMTAAANLADAGVEARVERGEEGRQRDSEAPRLLVGPWREVRDDRAVDGLRGGPAGNGVFATFKGPTEGAYHLIALNPAATPARDLGPAAGLVAALRSGDQAPTWIVTGSGSAAVRRAASSLDTSALRDRYAIAAPPRAPPMALPLQPGGSG